MRITYKSRIILIIVTITLCLLFFLPLALLYLKKNMRLYGLSVKIYKKLKKSELIGYWLAKTGKIKISDIQKGLKKLYDDESLNICAVDNTSSLVDDLKKFLSILHLNDFKLKKINVKGCEIDSIPQEVFLFKNLYDVRFTKNSKISVSNKIFIELPNLTILDLGNNTSLEFIKEVKRKRSRIISLSLTLSPLAKPFPDFTFEFDSLTHLTLKFSDDQIYGWDDDKYSNLYLILKKLRYLDVSLFFADKEFIPGLLTNLFDQKLPKYMLDVIKISLLQIADEKNLSNIFDKLSDLKALKNLTILMNAKEYQATSDIKAVFDKLKIKKGLRSLISFEELQDNH